MKKIKIYPAAALFNARETFFNIHLTYLLESEKGYGAKLPQKDGFEFGNLTNVLAELLPQGETNQAVSTIIYLLDVGKFIPETHVVIANLDEPLDPGVDVEQCYAKMMGKFVIGFRTDTRSPYGPSNYGGMHPFPTYQCDTFVSYCMPSKSIKEAEKEIKELVDKIDNAIQKNKNKFIDGIQKSALEIPEIKNIITGAKILFGGINNIYSEKSLREIAKRYLENKEMLLSFSPKIYSTTRGG